MSVKTFFEELDAEVAHLFKKLPAIEVKFESAFINIAPEVEFLDSLLLPLNVSTTVNNIIDKVKVGLAAASVTIQSAGANPTAQSILQGVVSNLGQLESAAQIKDPKTASEVTAKVTGIVASVNAILAAFPKTA